MKKLVKVTVFIAVFGVMFFVVSQVFREKFDYPPNSLNGLKLESSFYKEEKNQMDAVYIGSSTLYMAVNPLEIFEKCDITGYTFASPGQKMLTSSYYVKEVLKYQRPKVIVIETHLLFADFKTSFNRAALDYMRFSKDKIDAIKAANEKGETIASYMFTILRYHARWNNLKKPDFECFKDNSTLQFKGYSPAFWIKPQQKNGFANSDNSTQEINEANKKALDDIVDICKENNVKVLLLKTPSYEWTRGMSQVVENYARQKEIDFLDYNDFYEDIGILRKLIFMMEPI